MNRDDDFNDDDAVVDTSLVSDLASAPLLSNGAAVLDDVPRDRPRKLNVGRARNGRCVDVNCADVSIAFSSGFFSSPTDETVVDRRLKRLRAKAYKFIYFFPPHQIYHTYMAKYMIRARVSAREMK